MTVYTTEQKFNYLKEWVTSGQSVEDYCSTAGVSRNSINTWAKNILAGDYKSSLRDPNQKKTLIRKIERLESGAESKMNGDASASSTSLVMVSKGTVSRKSKSVPISIEYMGAKISIDEKSIESVFRALNAVNGCNL